MKNVKVSQSMADITSISVIFYDLGETEESEGENDMPLALLRRRSRKEKTKGN